MLNIRTHVRIDLDFFKRIWYVPLENIRTVFALARAGAGEKPAKETVNKPHLAPFLLHPIAAADSNAAGAPSTPTPPGKNYSPSIWISSKERRMSRPPVARQRWRLPFCSTPLAFVPGQLTLPLGGSVASSEVNEGGRGVCPLATRRERDKEGGGVVPLLARRGQDEGGGDMMPRTARQHPPPPL